MTTPLSVTELTSQIKLLLEGKFGTVAVRGEISNFKQHTSGHLYFSLKDPQAQIAAVLFRGNAASLPRLPKEGDQVQVVGELSVYAARGQYQLVVRELQFLGLGELLLKLHQLKEKLESQGLFDKGRKRPLPKLPKRIGVITSPTGAVIQDILNVLTRRFAGFHVILYPVKVQGEGAAQEVAQAIAAMNRYEMADVLIVGRGGGSIEDLWAFNEEIVARAIYQSKIPIISAVGHETDVTIADFVADVRAPTPSAAAEMVIAEKGTLIKFIEGAKEALQARLMQQLQSMQQRTAALARHPLLANPYLLISQPLQRVDDMRDRVDEHMALRLRMHRERLTALSQQMTRSSPLALIERQRERLASLAEHLASIDPRNLLKKGYALLYREKEKKLILSVADVRPGSKLVAQLADGTISATVNHEQQLSLL